ncbi:MAG: hypothetical protein IJN34_07730 [Clostridia bacterium]|nr:hypothetical protein [Clostridia bacterium]
MVEISGNPALSVFVGRPGRQRQNLRVRDTAVPKADRGFGDCLNVTARCFAAPGSTRSIDTKKSGTRMCT